MSVRTLAILVLTALVSTAVGQRPPQRADLQQTLSTNVPHYRIDATNLLEAVGQLASAFDLPLGVEWRGNVQQNKPIAREWINSTVEQILYDTVDCDINYQVRISNGVVHVWATSLADDPRNPLNITIPQFSVTNQYSRQAALMLRDQLSSVMSGSAKLPVSACTGSRGISSDETLVTVSMKNAQASQILDAILLRSRSAMWLAVFPDKQPDLGFLTIKSPWRNADGRQQPQLDFLPRFDDPVTGLYRGDWKMGLNRR